MVRLVGAVFVWGGCALCGIRSACEVRSRVRFLEDMVQALEILERELTLNRAALPELLDRLSVRSAQQAGMLFCSCVENMKKGHGFADAWGRALECAELREEEHVLLSGLSQVLGRYDVQGQGQALAHLRKELERVTARSREEAHNLGRIYSMLGMTAGGFLTLTLL